MKAVVILLALVLAGVGVYWLVPQSQPDNRAQFDRPVAQDEAAPPPARQRPTPAIRYTPQPIPTEMPAQVTTFTELRQVLRSRPDCTAGGRVGEWLDNMQERAVQASLDFAAAFGAQPPSDAYHAYDDETLTELASAGDSRAYMTLGHRASARGDSDTAKAAYRNAAVLGEEDALGFMIYTLGRARDQAERAGNEAAIEQAVMEQLAWHRVQEKRMGVLYFTPTERWSEQYLEENPALEAEATARGAELYQALNQERSLRGMDAFEDYPATIGAEELEASLQCPEK